jgi:hypothetical protein
MRPTDQLGAAALAYARLGYRVLPLHHPVSTNVSQGRGMLCSCGDPACGAVGKHPLTVHGLKDATSDPARLDSWWQRWPQANIGLVTGEVADVLDIDGPAGRAAVRLFTTDHDLRLEGPLVRTGSGWHLYLAPIGTGNRAGLLERVDWRGLGGYVVAPTLPTCQRPPLPVAAATHRRTPRSACAAAQPPRPRPSPAVSAGPRGPVPPNPCRPSLWPHRARAGTGRRRQRPPEAAATTPCTKEDRERNG